MGSQADGTSSRTPSVGAAAVLLHWTYLRAQAVLGRALADQYPTRATWDAAKDDADFVEALETLSQLVDEVRAASELLTEPSLDALAEFGGQHYARFLEAVEGIAERIGVEAEDLITVTLYG